VLTGHDVDAADWPTLAQLPTLVILMGGRALPAIVERLLAAGREPDTQVRCVTCSSIMIVQLTAVLADHDNPCASDSMHNPGLLRSDHERCVHAVCC
jgi:siroheme synthase